MCTPHCNAQDIVSADPGFTYVITNVPCISVDIVVYEDELSENGRRQLLQDEQ